MADTDDSSDYVARILKGSSSVFSGSMVAKAVGFLLNIVLSRGLGAAVFGIYSLGYIVLRLTREIATLGLQNGVVRFGAPQYEANEHAKLKGTLLATGGLGLGAGIGLGVLLFATAPWLAEQVFHDPKYTHVLQVFAFGLPFYTLTYLLSRMARAMGNMRLDVLLGSILQPLIFLLVAGGLIFAHQDLTSILYGFVASAVLAAASSAYAIYRLFPPLLSSLAPTFNVRALLRFSLPIIGVSLASIGLTYADRLMLGMYASSAALGIYQNAAKLSIQMRFILFAVNATFSPIISDLYHNDKREALDQLYADTVRWIVVLTLPVSVVLFTFAPEFMSIFGPEFREGGNLLRVLALAYLIVASVGSVGHMLQMTDHQDSVLVVDTGMALANVGLNWLLIRWYGAIGAAVATGFTQAIGNLVQIGMLYHFTRIQPFRWILWKPLAATAGAGLVSWITYTMLPSPFHWIVGIPALLLAYAGILFGLGLHPRDHSILTDVWSQLQTRRSKDSS